MKSRYTIRFIVRGFSRVALFVFACSSVQAETNSVTHPIVDDRFSIYFGGFFPQVRSDIRLDRDTGGGNGDDVSLEDALGLKNSDTVSWGGAVWRIEGRHRLEAEYLQLNRSGTRGAVTDPFQIGDHIVQIGARAETQFDMAIGRLTYGYSFFQDERTHWAVEAGLHWAELATEIALSGAIIDIETNTEIVAGSSVTEAGDVSAPLPHLGLSYSYAITNEVLVRAQLMGFALSVGDYSGSLIDAGFDLAYSPWRHFGIGAGFRYFDLRLEAGKNSLNGEFQFEYWGPTLFAVINF